MNPVLFNTVNVKLCLEEGAKAAGYWECPVGTEESGTAQCHLPLRSNVVSHSSDTPAEQLRGSKPCPGLSCLSLYLFSL